MEDRSFGGQLHNFELGGKTVLGFDTGLDAQSFAQAKLARHIYSPGFMVFPDGKIENWLPSGVEEKETMIIWGPAFPGNPLTVIINDNADEALLALHYWLMAVTTMADKKYGIEDSFFPGPPGVLIARGGEGFPEGTVFFPPAWLHKRSLDAEGEKASLEAGRFLHPGLTGKKAISFSAGILLYRIFCRTLPFSCDAPCLTELHKDMREAVFIPPELSSPGLDPEMASLISLSLKQGAKSGEEKTPPSPETIINYMGIPYSKPFSAWFRTLTPEEKIKIDLEKKQYIKRSGIKVKTRRFILRNTSIITGLIIALFAIGLIARSVVKYRAELPSTRGMPPLEVVEVYYNAFNDLDHSLMEACVSGGAGKQDISTATNLYVISKVRQAYEFGGESFMSAGEWIKNGSKPTFATVFGITDFSIKQISQESENATFEVNYILWVPEGSGGEPRPSNQVTEEIAPGIPESLPTTDRLSLAFIKEAWHITNIIRTTN